LVAGFIEGVVHQAGGGQIGIHNTARLAVCGQARTRRQGTTHTRVLTMHHRMKGLDRDQNKDKDKDKDKDKTEYAHRPGPDDIGRDSWSL
jgi:hypothetical protein